MSVPDRLRADLAFAMRARDKTEVSMIRTLIGAIENAEAVEGESSIDPKIGLNHDLPRKILTDEDVVHILSLERSETAAAADGYQEMGLADEAEELVRRVRIIDRYLS